MRSTEFVYCWTNYGIHNAHVQMFCWPLGNVSAPPLLNRSARTAIVEAPSDAIIMVV